jgi:iron complex transport system substrate-binding protein
MPPRVVSLIASSTEIACALGFRDQLVGRSHECDFPPGVRELPACSEPKFSADGTSYQIDARVKALLQEGLSVYRVSAEKLRELSPDVILTQIQCEVCAVSRKDVEEATCEWLGARPRIVSLNPNRLEDLWEDIRRVAGALDAPARGEALVRELRGRMERLSARFRALGPRPGVACVEWVAPLMGAGNWMPQLVDLAGGRTLLGEVGTHSPYLSLDQLHAVDPEVILVTPCGFDLDRTRAEMPALDAQPGWRSLRAVRSGRVYLADGNQYFNRPGPRLVESLEILGEILFDGLTPSRFQGSGWVRHP